MSKLEVQNLWYHNTLTPFENVLKYYDVTDAQILTIERVRNAQPTQRKTFFII
jgi:hypothetical protein